MGLGSLKNLNPLSNLTRHFNSWTYLTYLEINIIFIWVGEEW